jgi:hypothetical protein
MSTPKKKLSTGLKIALIVSGAIILSAGGYLVYRKFFKKDDPLTDLANDSTSVADMDNKALTAPEVVASQPVSNVGVIPRTMAPASNVATNYTPGQRVYARTNSGLYKTPNLRSANITHNVVKDQAVGVFEKASVNGFAWVNVVLKDATGKFVPMIKYIPFSALRPANTAKGEKN